MQYYLIFNRFKKIQNLRLDINKLTENFVYFIIIFFLLLT